MEVHGRYWESLVTVLKLLSWLIHTGNKMLFTLPNRAPQFLCYFIAGSENKLAHMRVAVIWPFKWLFLIYVCACIILFKICILNYMECLESKKCSFLLSLKKNNVLVNLQKVS